MKRAKYVVTSVDVICPHCGESIPDPKDASFLWPTQLVQAGKVVWCDHCAQQSALPTVRNAAHVA